MENGPNIANEKGGYTLVRNMLIYPCAEMKNRPEINGLHVCAGHVHSVHMYYYMF